jgi:thioredoxin reductase
MTDQPIHDYLIVGAGPAGLQAGYWLGRAGHDYRILEAGPAAGTFFTRYPRHRKLISINKVHTGWDDPELKLRVDWNSLITEEHSPLFTEQSPRYFPAAEEMVHYLGRFAEQHRLDIRYNTRIERISRSDGIFVLTDSEGNRYRSRSLIMATGVSQPYLPPIPGVELAETYVEMPTDPADFTGQRVLIIGRGNSAFETADNLIETASVIHVAGPGSLKLAWQTHFVGHLRAVNNNFLDTYQLKSQNALLDGEILSIAPDGDGYLVRVSFARVNEVVKAIRYDRVLLATGFRFDADLFDDDIRPELTISDRFPAQTPAWESPNVAGLFFAGTITQVRDFKRSTSGFIHGFRYNVRALTRILDQRHHDTDWPGTELPATAAAVTDAILARVNRTSARWQVFGFLADAVLVNPDGLRYLEEVPVDYLHAEPEAFGRPDRYLTVTLEYGEDHDRINPFDISAGRNSQQDTSGLDGRYLHPVVRLWRAGELISEHHVTENLENEWDSEDVHRAPLLAYLERELTRTTVDA